MRTGFWGRFAIYMFVVLAWIVVSARMPADRRSDMGLGFVFGAAMALASRDMD